MTSWIDKGGTEGSLIVRLRADNPDERTLFTLLTSLRPAYIAGNSNGDVWSVVLYQKTDEVTNRLSNANAEIRRLKRELRAERKKNK